MEVERTLGPDPLRFELPPGPQQITVRSPGLDLALTLRPPDGPATRVDHRWMTRAPEVVLIRAELPTLLELERAHPGAGGPVSIRTEPARDEAVLAFSEWASQMEAAGRPDAEAREQAVQGLLEAAEALREQGLVDLAAYARVRAGELAWQLGWPDARERLEAALAAASDPSIRARAHLHLAQVMQNLGLPQAALTSLAAAREAAPEDRALRARALMVESEALRYVGRSVEALALARRSRELAADSGDPGLMSDGAAAEGWCHVRLGTDDEATRAFERSLELAREAADLRRVGIALHNMGIVRSNLQRDWAGALEYYEQAIEIRRRIGDLFGLAFSLDAAGEMDSTLKNVRAIERHREALEIRRRLGTPRGEAQTLISLGSALARLGRAEEGLPYLEEGARRMGEAGDLNWEAYGHFRVGRARHKLGRYDRAVASARRALEVAESLRARIATEEGRTDFTDSVRWYFDLYVSAAGDQFAMDGERRWVAAALDGAERARARALVEMMGAVELPRSLAVPESELQAVEELRSRILALESEQRYARATGAPREEVQARETRILEQMARFDREMQRLDRADPRRTALFAPPIVTLDEAQAMAGDDQTLLYEIYLGAGGAYALAIGTSTATVVDLGDQDPIDELARALHRNLSARNEGPVGESASDRAARIEAADAEAATQIEELRARLFEPLGDGLKTRDRVVVVADGALHYVPFAALLPRHEVVTLPSLTVLKTQRERLEAVGDGGLGIVGDPVFGPEDPRLESNPPSQTHSSVRASDVAPPRLDLPRLRFAGAEVEAIAKQVPSNERTVRVGFDATRDWVVGGGLRLFSTIHFATHGVLDTTHPERSGLLLAQLDEAGRPIPGFLTLSDIYRLRLRADVVTLSACETALGREVRSEGLIGLTRGFLHAGARRVVASLWKVHDRATQELMARFYQGLLQDRLPAPAALRRAQHQLAEHPRFAAPYYWAGFVLQGDWREPRTREASGTRRPRSPGG